MNMAYGSVKNINKMISDLVSKDNLLVLLF